MSTMTGPSKVSISGIACITKPWKMTMSATSSSALMPPGAPVQVTVKPRLWTLGGDIDADSFNRAARETDVDAAFRATSNARKTVLAGFTTVRDFGGEVTVALARAVETGMVTGPHVFPSRNPIGITGGHCDVTGFAPGVLETTWQDGIADGPDEVVKAVRYQIKHGAKVIKTCATAGVLSFEESVGAQQSYLRKREPTSSCQAGGRSKAKL